MGELLDQSQIHIPRNADATIGIGGRNGYHTEYLSPLLNEMTQVYRMEEGVEW